MSKIKEKKRHVPVGTIVFYSLLAVMIVGGLCVFHYIRTAKLRPFLENYEASNPKYKQQEIFHSLFQSKEGGMPDFETLYDLAGVEDTAFEGKDSFVAYMNESVTGKEITCVETSAGLSGDKKFIVKADEKKIATFTLTEAPKATESEISRWELGTVEVFFERTKSYTIQTTGEHSVQINGVTLGEDAIIQKTETVAESYLPEGLHGRRTTLWKVENLLRKPTVTILDESGNSLTVTEEDETCRFAEVEEEETEIPEELRARVISTAEAYGKYMIGAGSLDNLRKYFDTKSKIYKTILLSDTWMQSYTGYAFDKETVSEYRRYTDTLFSVHVGFSLNITRKNGSVKEYTFSSTLFFTGDTSPLVSEMTNVDIQKEIIHTRYIFIYEDTVLSDFFLSSEDHVLTVPAVTAPDGQIFAGWAKEERTDDGKIKMTILFKPSATETIFLPEDYIPEPVTLYAVFQPQSDFSSSAVSSEAAASDDIPAASSGLTDTES